MTDFSSFKRPHLRRTVLEILAEDAGYAANEGVLATAQSELGFHRGDGKNGSVFGFVAPASRRLYEDQSAYRLTVVLVKQAVVSRQRPFRWTFNRGSDIFPVRSFRHHE